MGNRVVKDKNKQLNEEHVSINPSSSSRPALLKSKISHQTVDESQSLQSRLNSNNINRSVSQYFNSSRRLIHPNKIINHLESRQKMIKMSNNKDSSLTKQSHNSRQIKQKITRPYISETRRNYFPSLRAEELVDHSNSSSSANRAFSTEPRTLDPLYNIETAVFVALFDYHARHKQEISIRKGDCLKVFDDSDLEWWFVERVGFDDNGYIQKSFIALKDSIDSKEWYFSNISRRDAERMLLLKNNTDGTFLIRKSETNPEELSLSVKLNESVMHYRIHKTLFSKSFKKGYYICQQKIFPSLQKLILFYTRESGGLNCTLKRICPKLMPPCEDIPGIIIEKFNFNRKSLLLRRKLISRNFGEI